MMEAARTSETLVQLYQTTRCYNPEDSHLHTHHRENLKSYMIVCAQSILNNKNLSISGCHSGEYEGDSLLGYCAM
jgi:hypothetical protein